MNVYENCPSFENDGYLIRFVEKTDADGLLEVYSDKNALPFFNSDNCDGDNFYYPDKERMEKAIEFWLNSYRTGWFVRWTIIDKRERNPIGTIEMFRRSAEDDFDGCGVLRVDVGSFYERSEVLESVLKLFVPKAYELFGCDEIITKVPVYAVERIKAAENCGFEKTDRLLIGTHDHYAYNGYWSVSKDD